MTHHRLWPSGPENMDSSAIYWNNQRMLGNSQDNYIIIFPQKGNLRGATAIKTTVDELWYLPKSSNYVYMAWQKRDICLLSSPNRRTTDWELQVMRLTTRSSQGFSRCCHGNTDKGAGVLTPWSERQISLLATTGLQQVVENLLQVSGNFYNSFW